MTFFVRSLVPCSVALLLSTTLFAQQKSLGPEQYFRSNFKGITQSLPTPNRWLDGQRLLFTRDGEKRVLNAKTGQESLATEADLKPATEASEPAKPRVSSRSGNLFAKVDGKEFQLTFDEAPEQNPTLSPDNKYVAYTKNNNLFVAKLEEGSKELALTTDGSATVLNGYASWVYMEEILGRSSNYKAFWWSPDSKKIAFMRSDESTVPVFTITNAKGLHGEVETMRYPKVGDPNPAVKMGVVSVTGGPAVFAKVNTNTDDYWGAAYWKPDGSALLAQWMPRSQDELRILAVNPSTGDTSIFYHEKQKTWIQLDDEGQRLQFLNNGKGFVLFSDETGWRHLYFHDMNGKRINAITSGNFTVMDIIEIDEAKNTIYFVARSRENSARRDMYSVQMNGKKLTRLTFGEYSHQMSFDFSPTKEYFVTTYSNSATPPRVAVASTKGKWVADLGTAAGPEFTNYQLAKTEFIRVKSDDGLFELPMKVTWPTNMEKGKSYPVLISIYGGPDAGTCWDTWSLTGNQQWWAKEGLIQVVMDHRASGHFGKAGVNYMHRNLGHWELIDYATMVKWLVANGQADPKRIAITGFSYGGYLSSLAVTKRSDVFTHGMAGGPVTDWTLYDSHYTERFMDLPTDNPDGYKTSSVFNFVDKYNGGLQLVHGEIDENVHLQNTLQLASKLQDAKKDFQLMIYPGGRHGWGGNKNTHFNNLKNQFIYQHLLQMPMPKEMWR